MQSYEQWNRCRVHSEFRGNNQVASDYHDRSAPNQNKRNPIYKRIHHAVIQISVASVFPFIKTSVMTANNMATSFAHAFYTAVELL